MDKENSKIIMGTPDGHLYEGSKKLFEYMGFQFPNENPPYFIEFDYSLEGRYISLLSVGLHRPLTIIDLVSSGDLVLGITGGDDLYEKLKLPLNGTQPKKSLEEHLSNKDLKLLLDLEFRPSHLVLAVHKDSNIYSFEDFKREYSNGNKIKVASEFTHATRDFFGSHRIKYDFNETPGKTETPLAQRIVNAIVDVAETGNSILDSGGIFFTKPYVLQKSTPKLITSNKSYELWEEFIDDFVGRMERAIEEYKDEDPRAFEDKLEGGLRRQLGLYPQLKTI